MSDPTMDKLKEMLPDLTGMDAQEMFNTVQEFLLTDELAKCVIHESQTDLIDGIAYRFVQSQFPDTLLVLEGPAS